MKGVKELKVTSQSGDGSIRAYELRMDQVETDQWFTADFSLENEDTDSDEDDLSEDEFYTSLRMVSRKVQPSEPDEAS